MKKLFSLLTLALLTMSAWGTTVTFVPSTTTGSNTTASGADEMTLDGVTISTTTGAFAAAEYRFGANSTTTVTSTVGNITKVEFTSTASYGSKYGPHLFSGDGYSAQSGSKVGTWTGDAASFSLSASAQVRCSQIVVTIADQTSDELVPPVFHPAGGEITQSTEVTLTCATPNAEIQYYECDPTTHEIDWTTYNYYTEPFYVNETKSYVAFSSKGNDVSEYVYADFVKVLPTLAAPTFTPATGATFEDDLAIRIDAAEGAEVWYTVNGVEDVKEAPVYLTLTETSTVTAFASMEGYNDSEEVTATYTKVAPATGTAIVFNYADDAAFTDAASYTVNRPGASFTVSNGLINGHYRIYKGQTITFTSTAGNITRIEFDGVSGNPVSNFGEVEGMTYSNPNGLWIANTETNTVTFTATQAQVRCTEIRVYVDGEIPADFVAAPTLPASQNFDDSMSVVITNNDAEAILYYSYDNENWTEYTEALTITETTTVYAKAVKGEIESQVVSATYTKNEPAEAITTLAQVNALANGTEFTFGGNAVVTAQNGQYLWLRDASGYGLIYGNINATFAPGTVLNQNWTAKTKIYNGLMEYVNAADLSASEETNAELAAIQTITELDTTMINAYVQVLNVKSFAVSGKNVTATMTDGTTMVMFNTFSESIPTEEGNYTVEGVVSTYNGLQLIILSIEGYVPEVHNVNNITEALALNDNETFTMYNDVVVTYQNGNRMWIRDTENKSGLIYGTVEGEYANGDILSDGWTAKKVIYNNVPEFTEPQEVSNSGDTREAAPFEVEAFTNDNVNEYVILKGLNVLADANNDKRFYNAADSTVLFNTFGLTLPTIEEGKTYDVTGIVTIYYGNAQLYITEMTEAASEPDFLRGDVDDNGEVKIGDVTALISYLLSGDATGINLKAADCDQNGEIKIGDVTTLISYLLSGSWGE